MPRTLRYTQRTVIRASFEAIWAWLADPARYPELHPLMRKLTVEEEGGDDEESFVSYVVVDGLPVVGSLELPVRYRVHMTRRRAARDLAIRATATPGLVTTSRWSFETVDGGTRVQEAVELTAPWPIAGYALRQSLQAHAVMLDNLERRLA